MKLSESGISKFWSTLCVGIELSSKQIEQIDNGLNKIDFQQKDFQDSVVLTVEEAQICLGAIKTQKEVFRSILKNNEGVDAMAVFEHILKERIENTQSETQYE